MLTILKGKHAQLGTSIQEYAAAAAEALAKKYNLNPTSLRGTVERLKNKQFAFSLEGHLFRGWTERILAHGATPYQAVDSAFARLAERIAHHKKRMVDHMRHHDNHHFVDKIKLSETMIKPDMAI